MKIIGSVAGKSVAVQTQGNDDALMVGNVRLSSAGADVKSARTYAVNGEEVVTWTEELAKDGFQEERSFYAVRAPDGSLSAPKEVATEVSLRAGAFDPTEISAAPSKTPGEVDLVVLQLATQMLPGYETALKSLGVELGPFIGDNAFLAHVPKKDRAQLLNQPFVRAATDMTPEQKAGPGVLDMMRLPAFTGWTARRYDLLVMRPELKAKVLEAIREEGVQVDGPPSESVLMTLDLTPSQLAKVMSLPEVTWVDLFTPAENDVDLARITGGAAEVERVAGYTGQGLRGHVLEGIYAQHPEFAANDKRQAPIAIDNANVDGHGHQTFGIIYGEGRVNPRARGILPDAQGYYTHNSAVMNNDRRFDLTRRLIEEHKVMFQTASWGYAQTTEYGARSAEMDDIIFRLDLPVTQSQSNTGSTRSRPQAWAKNIISVGAVKHRNNTDPADDNWTRGGSIGPATDGRAKPDLAFWYDATFTTAGAAGYTESFGGTSGATPTVNGYMGLIIQMWTDGIFGNKLPHPHGTDVDSRFANRPHASTVKALAIASAKQWQFEGATHDLTRTHQGWGMPDVKQLYEMRDKVFAVNETQPLRALEGRTYELDVAPGEPTLKVSMVYSDPVGAVAATQQRVNDLNLKVTAPDGTVYYGNVGLMEHMFSTPGGAPDTKDTVENVFVKDPAPGKWKVEVLAAEVNQDSHLESSDLDADFALVAIGAKRPA
jgi:hypothetical protein